MEFFIVVHLTLTNRQSSGLKFVLESEAYDWEADSFPDEMDPSIPRPYYRCRIGTDWMPKAGKKLEKKTKGRWAALYVPCTSVSIVDFISLMITFI